MSEFSELIELLDKDVRGSLKSMAICGQPSIWRIVIDKTNMFNNVANRSLDFLSNNFEQHLVDKNAITENDWDNFCVLADTAYAEVQMLLARRIIYDAYSLYVKKDSNGAIVEMSDDEKACAKIYREYVFMYDIVVGENHEVMLLPSLEVFINEYFIRRVLELWFNVDFKSEESKAQVLSVIHYRKRPIKSRIDPLF